MSFDGNLVVRSFDAEGGEWFLAAEDAGLLQSLHQDGLIIDYTVRSRDPLVLESPRLPVATFPYEWSPTMLKDAALLTLDIATRSWDAGFHLRDASAFNVIFEGGRPIMVDLGSFRPGHTPFFLAYGQFCDHFLNPLAVAESLGMSPRSLWWSLEGLSAERAKQMMRGKALRLRYLRHIWARAKLETSTESLGASERRNVRANLGLPAESVRRAMEHLRSTVEGIEVDPGGAWGSYESECSYDQAETERKSEFVARAASRSGGRVALDIGANTGHYSEILARHFDTVIAIEPDEAAADVLYGRLKSGTLPANISPMVIDVVDPSGGRGFANLERPSALERIVGADLVIWLAVIHHLVFGRNVPLPMVFELANRLSSRHVFEHVDPADDMAVLLLAAKDETPWPMDRETFEATLAHRFRVVEAVDVTPTRRLYEAVAL